MKILIPFLILNLPEGGCVTILLTAYPLGTDYYSSLQELPSQPIAIPHLARTKTGSLLTDDATGALQIAGHDTLIDLSASYQRLQGQVVAYVLDEQPDQLIIESIRRNTIITAENDKICTWNYLDPGKTIVGEVTMFRTQDIEILEQILTTLSSRMASLTPATAQSLLEELQTILDAARLNNPSAFITAIHLDLSQTKASMSTALDEDSQQAAQINLGQVFIQFLRRNQVRMKKLMHPIQASIQHDTAIRIAMRRPTKPLGESGDEYSTPVGSPSRSKVA